MASRAGIPAAETPGLKKPMIDFSRLASATRAARRAPIGELWATRGKADASTETDTRVFSPGRENTRRTYPAAFVKRKVALLSMERGRGASRGPLALSDIEIGDVVGRVGGELRDDRLSMH